MMADGRCAPHGREWSPGTFLVSWGEGSFTPAPPPALLDKITDMLLVVASDAVSAVGAEEPALSGNATFRLLAWTVADARGANLPGKSDSP